MQVEYLDVGSPVTNKYYLNAPKGEIYGLDHTAKRFGSPDIMMTLRPETDIPGLLLTGRGSFVYTVLFPNKPTMAMWLSGFMEVVGLFNVLIFTFVTM